MMLAELAAQLLPSFKPSRQKDAKTAVLYLAKALDCPDPQHCSPELYSQPLVTLYRHIEDSLTAQGKSLHTIRNTRNVISRLFRLAQEQHLVSLAPVTPTRSYDFKHRPHRSGLPIAHNNGTFLPYTQWPSELQDAFTAFKTWATAPIVPGRPAKLRKRPVSVEAYRHLFEGYFGYLHHQAHLTPAFDALFDYDLVNAYVHWHINDCHKRPTATIHKFLSQLRAMIRQYRPDNELRAKLLTLMKTIPVPQPVYDKQDAWVSTTELRRVACALWPQKTPAQIAKNRASHRPVHHGLLYAGRAGLSLMLQLWTYIPYRQRNMREMRLGDNLRQDDGRWHIVFRGEQLKIASKRGKTNVFDLPFPSQLVPVLEDYLNIWRPILLTKAEQSDNHVFLTQRGVAYHRHSLHSTLSNILYRYTGKYWHPHIIRSVWATEWIRGGGDFFKAAIMLNDKLETVIANYAHLRDENVAEEVFEVLDRRNGQGK